MIILLLTFSLQTRDAVLSHPTIWDIKCLGQHLALEDNPLQRKAAPAVEVGKFHPWEGSACSQKPYLKVYVLCSHTTRLLAS